MIILELATKCFVISPFRANFTKWSNTLKQFVGNLPTNCLNVFDHFVGLALKGLYCVFYELRSKLLCLLLKKLNSERHMMAKHQFFMF